MPRLKIPNNASLHTINSFLRKNQPFIDNTDDAVLEFHPRWAHMDPLALVIVAAWGTWCQGHEKLIVVQNLGHHCDYAARMKLFQHLGVEYDPGVREHEEAGRFLPITQVANRQQVGSVIADISALLHLQDDPESLAAVQYCISELLRNVLEHSDSPAGAFVCAHRYTKKEPHRVTIAVADCGRGIAAHLGRVHREAQANDLAALGLAMRPGITGAIPGPYGTSDNAGAGLFITRCIAKGTGGYFSIVSGRAAFRQKRSLREEDQTVLYPDPFDDPRHDKWLLDSTWMGTAVAVEIRTEKIGDYEGFFQWIFKTIPKPAEKRRRIRFT